MALNSRVHGCSSHIHQNGTKQRHSTVRCPRYTARAAVPAAEAGPPASVPPPDVAPDVLLLLSSELQQLDLVGGVTQLQSHIASAQQTSQQALQQQQLQSVLLPRTVSRLQGLQQLPGFIPSLAPQPDPQLVLCQQEVSSSTVTAWWADMCAHSSCTWWCIYVFECVALVPFSQHAADVSLS